MARPLRIEFTGALYHVTSRGDGRDDIFLCYEDRKLWLDVMDNPVKALADVFQDIQPQFPIFVAQENIVPPVTARSDVVEGASKLYT